MFGTTDEHISQECTKRDSCEFAESVSLTSQHNQTTNQKYADTQHTSYVEDHKAAECGR